MTAVAAHHSPARFARVEVVVIAEIAALAVLVVAWWGASDQVRVADQWTWGALGLLALMASGVVNGAVLISGRRRLARRQLVFAIDASPISGPASSAPLASTAARASAPSLTLAPAAPLGPAADALPVAAAVMTRYHRPTCRLVAGKAVEATPVARHEAAGRRPCGVCRP